MVTPIIFIAIPFPLCADLTALCKTCLAPDLYSLDPLCALMFCYFTYALFTYDHVKVENSSDFASSDERVESRPIGRNKKKGHKPRAPGARTKPPRKKAEQQGASGSKSKKIPAKKRKEGEASASASDPTQVLPGYHTLTKKKWVRERSVFPSRAPQNAIDKRF